MPLIVFALAIVGFYIFLSASSNNSLTSVSLSSLLHITVLAILWLSLLFILVSLIEYLMHLLR